MATNSRPSLKRKRKRDSEPPPAPTSLMSLGDDMLAEILSRLPSLPSLASAALASPRLCSVASSPAVFNPFLSRAPLLGYFVSVYQGAVPVFHRALLRRDRHLGAIVRRSDLHLTDFEEYEWRLVDCRHGLLLLSRYRQLVVFDPVSRSRLRITPHQSFSITSLQCLLPACSGDIDGGPTPTSFRVLCMQETKCGRVRAHVYSSRMGEWCSHSRPPKGITGPRIGVDSNHLSMRAGGRIYWRSHTGGPLISLDVGSMDLSNVALPEKLHCGPRSYAVGETEDGTTCLVAISEMSGKKLVLRVWFLKEEDDSWELHCMVDDSKWDMLSNYRPRVEKVCDVTAGVVLVCTKGLKNRGLHYLAFRLKNLDEIQEGNTKLQLEADEIQEGNTKLQLEADFFTSAGGWVRPHFMAWQRPSLKAGPSENAATRGQKLVGKKTSLKDQEAGGSKKKTSQEAGSSKKN